MKTETTEENFLRKMFAYKTRIITTQMLFNEFETMVREDGYCCGNVNRDNEMWRMRNQLFLKTLKRSNFKTTKK